MRSTDKEQLKTMLYQENKSYVCNDYLNLEISDNYLMIEMNEVRRRKICEWYFKVVDRFSVDREVVLISINYFDRFLALRRREMEANELALSRNEDDEKNQRQGIPDFDSKMFQLVATASIYLAMKLHGGSIDTGSTKCKQKLSIKFFADLSRGQFSESQISKMEMNILTILKWNLNPPTSMKFISYLLRCLPVDYGSHKRSRALFEQNVHPEIIDERVVHVLYQLSRYLTELSTCIYSLSVCHRPSTLAFSAIMISMNLIDPNALSFSSRSLYFQRVYNITSLRPNHSLVIDAVQNMQSMCPEICNYSKEPKYDEYVSSHPITIARNAGFLAMTSRSKEKSHSPTNIRHFHANQKSSYI